MSKLVGEHEVVRRAESGSSTKGVSNSLSESTTRGMSFGSTVGMSFDARGGMTTSSSSSSGFSSSMTRGTSITTSQSATYGYADSIHKRPLVTPDEVGRLFGDPKKLLALALVSGQQPVPLERLQYFTWDWLAGRYGRHPDHPPPATLAVVEAKAKAEEARQLAAREAEERAQEAERQRIRQQQLDAWAYANRSFVERMRDGFLDWFDSLGERRSGDALRAAIYGAIVGVVGSILFNVVRELIAVMGR